MANYIKLSNEVSKEFTPYGQKITIMFGKKTMSNLSKVNNRSGGMQVSGIVQKKGNNKHVMRD